MKKTVAGVRQSSTVNIIKYLKEKERGREECFGPELLESFHLSVRCEVTRVTRIIIMMCRPDTLTP